MPVRTHAVPEEAVQSGNHWQDLRRHSQRVQDTSIELPVSYPAYYLSLNPVVAGQRVEGAVSVGWRHFVQSGGVATQLMIEAVSDRRFRVSRHRSFRDDEPERNLLQRHLSPQEHQDRSFELRALLVPPLVNLALWLKAEDGGSDLFIPVDTCVRGLKAEEAHTADEFFRLLLAPARDLMESLGPKANARERRPKSKQQTKPKRKRKPQREPKPKRRPRRKAKPKLV